MTDIDVMLGLLIYSTAESATQWKPFIQSWDCVCLTKAEVWISYFLYWHVDFQTLCKSDFVFVLRIYGWFVEGSFWFVLQFLYLFDTVGTGDLCKLQKLKWPLALWKFYLIYYRNYSYLINNRYFLKLLFAHSFRWWMWSQDGPPLQTASSFKRNCLQVLTIITVRNCKIKMTKTISNSTHQDIFFSKLLSTN